jgi:hypothetical protein
VNVGSPQDELKAELEALEQEELDDRLAGADRVPLHTPASPVGLSNSRERELRWSVRTSSADAQVHPRKRTRTTRRPNFVNCRLSWPCNARFGGHVFGVAFHSDGLWSSIPPLPSAMLSHELSISSIIHPAPSLRFSIL